MQLKFLLQVSELVIGPFYNTSSLEICVLEKHPSSLSVSKLYHLQVATAHAVMTKKICFGKQLKNNELIRIKNGAGLDRESSGTLLTFLSSMSARSQPKAQVMARARHAVKYIDDYISGLK